MVNGIDSRLLEALQASTCFGIAHDETVPECKKCDVEAQCRKRSEGADIPTPMGKILPPSGTSPKKDKAKSSAKSDTAPKKTSPKKQAPAKSPAPAPTPSNLPDFKPMSLDELKDLAKQRNVEWKEYGNDNITRMRLIMALKKSY